MTEYATYKEMRDADDKVRQDAFKHSTNWGDNIMKLGELLNGRLERMENSLQDMKLDMQKMIDSQAASNNTLNTYVNEHNKEHKELKQNDRDQWKAIRNNKEQIIKAGAIVGVIVALIGYIAPHIINFITNKI